MNHVPEGFEVSFSALILLLSLFLSSFELRSSDIGQMGSEIPLKIFLLNKWPYAQYPNPVHCFSVIRCWNTLSAG